MLRPHERNCVIVGKPKPGYPVETACERADSIAQELAIRKGAEIVAYDIMDSGGLREYASNSAAFSRLLHRAIRMTGMYEDVKLEKQAVDLSNPHNN